MPANPNIKPSNQAVVAATAAPVSQGAGTLDTGWVSLVTYDAIQAIVSCGVLGASATVDAKLQQATSSGGAGAKDITGKSITQLVKATDDGKLAVINCRSDELDVANSFTHVRLRITVGTAASLVAGLILGHYARYAPATALAAVAQTV